MPESSSEPSEETPRVDTDAARGAARLARQVALALDELCLSPAQYRLLAFLADGQAASSAVAGRLAITRPSATELIDGLVARGLVERRSDPSDRRRVPVVITRSGRTTLARADREVTAKLEGIAACIDSPADAECAMQGLRLWNAAIKRPNAQT